MSEAPQRCPFCGARLEVVDVHGHGQCTRCGTNVDPCCSGAGEAGPDGTAATCVVDGVGPRLFQDLFARLGGPQASVGEDALHYALTERLGCDLDTARLVAEAGARIGIVRQSGPRAWRLAVG